MIISQKQKKTKFKPRIKLNHNIKLLPNVFQYLLNANVNALFSLSLEKIP